MKALSCDDRRVVNIHDATFTPFMSGDVVDGEVLQLNNAKPLGSEGDLTDHDGAEYGSGDLVWLRDGTTHSSTTKGGCLVAVYAKDEVVRTEG